MITWDELIDRFAYFERGSRGHERWKFVHPMHQVLPSLRQVVEEQFPNTHLSTGMLALNLTPQGASKIVTIQCVGEDRFRVGLNNNKFEVLEEEIVDLSNTVEQVIQYLEMSRQEK
jgi:hypothetical protein